MLEAVFIILLLLAFCMVAYKGAVHEFQILQKDWKPTIDWGALLSEQLPLVIRNVEPTWQGSWTRKTTAKAWPIQVHKDGAVFKTRWNEWLAAAPGQPPLTKESTQELSAIVAPPLEFWEDHGFRRWSWIPSHLLQSQCRVLGPQAVQGVQRTAAAATVLQATDGAPLTVWLAHEGAIPTKAAGIVTQDPWSLETEVPWITEVKFIEIRIRPGNALVIPTHWYWALRSEGTGETMADGSWYWTAEFQTPISWLVSKVRNKK